jgi:hypothetical protein
MKTRCENCNKSLQPNSLMALICRYECTFCIDRAKNILNKYPNCGGDFKQRTPLIYQP